MKPGKMASDIKKKKLGLKKVPAGGGGKTMLTKGAPTLPFKPKRPGK